MRNNYETIAIIKETAIKYFVKALRSGYLLIGGMIQRKREAQIPYRFGKPQYMPCGLRGLPCLQRE